jgi:NMD protein affecting ribosome stability and mRNA decay
MRLAERGRRKPPAVKQNREGSLSDLLWLFPDQRFVPAGTIESPAVCERCHASLRRDHWVYDARRYAETKALPDVHAMLCPGCLRVERRLYEGEVTVRHRWDVFDKEMVLHLIHNEEARLRAANPTARIALIEDRGDELYILTTTQFLAERIGKALRASCHGTLRLSRLPRERFVRVWWELLSNSPGSDRSRARQ